MRAPAAKLLQPLLTPPKSGEHVDVEILTRSKDEAENKKLFEKIIELIGQGVRVTPSLPDFLFRSGIPCFTNPWLTLLACPNVAQNKVGTLPKDKMAGKFVTEWQNLLQSAQVDFKEIDVAAGVSALLAAKDSEELVRCAFAQSPPLPSFCFFSPSVLGKKEH